MYSLQTGVLVIRKSAVMKIIFKVPLFKSLRKEKVNVESMLTYETCSSSA